MDSGGKCQFPYLYTGIDLFNRAVIELFMEVALRNCSFGFKGFLFYPTIAFNC
jgi:hypothetical protein